MDALEGAVAETVEDAQVQVVSAEEGEAAPESASESSGSASDSSPESASDSSAEKPGNQLTDEEILHSITALIYASPDPISERKLASLLDGPDAARVKAAIEALKAKLDASGLPLELRSIAGGWQILTVPRMGEVVARLFQERKAERISPAALETLAVIAYRQPVSKAEIEAIRGVQVAPILRSLVDRGLVRVVGRADVPGHPLQYGTSKAFLDRFGLGGIDDLPRDSELAR
jgi:segregation and condensation protein B